MSSFLMRLASLHTATRLSWLLLTLILLSGSYGARAQRRYGVEFTDKFRVVVGADTLRQAWAGGFNSASYAKIDLNGDGADDLYVHDQTAQRHLTFIATNTPNGWYWRHDPAYESAFPNDRAMLYTTLRDYDGDGRPDLFGVYAAQYRALYRNVAYPGGVGFRFELVEDTLVLDNNHTWLSTSIYGQSIIEDFDNDGDPDILDFAYGNNFFNFYRNTGSVGGAAPTFHQELQWSGVVRCAGAGQACQTYAFPGTFCRPAAPAHGANADYALCAADIDGDGDRDLLIGQQYCRDLGLLVNQGSNANPIFTASSRVAPYPAGPPAANLVHTPAATYTDLTFDGQPDLLVAPWLTGLESMVSPFALDQYDTRHAAWLYRRTGPGQASFQFERNDFLLNEMIDVGNQSAPALGDLDGDGDLDLLVGNQGDLTFMPADSGNRFSSFLGKLTLYRNVGTPQRAVFRWETDDFSNLSALNRRALVPFLVDLDGNGSLDLVFRSTTDPYAGSVAGARNELGYILNTAPAGQPAVFAAASFTLLRLNLPAGTTLTQVVKDRMMPTFYDLDGDGDPDLLIGTPVVVGTAQSSAVQVFENHGGALSTAFLYNPALLGPLPGSPNAPAPAVADLDGDGQPELLIAADDGELKIWPGVLAAPYGAITAAPERNLTLNHVTNTYGAASLGTRLALAAGDLDGDGHAEILVGTGGGGLRLVHHQPNGLTGLADAATTQAGTLNVFPNPATGNCTVELLATTGPAIELRELTLRDGLGRVVWRGAARGVRQAVPLTGLAAGIYALTVTTSTNRIFARRLSVVAP